MDQTGNLRGNLKLHRTEWKGQYDIKLVHSKSSAEREMYSTKFLRHRKTLKSIIQKAWTDISRKRLYRWKIRAWQMFNIISHWEMKIKTTTSYHYTPMRMSKTKIVVTPNAGKDATEL